MKTLILTCNTGEGHNSTSSAVRESFERHGEPCDTVDSLSFLSPKVSDLVSKTHSRIYRHIPKIFGLGYRIAEAHPRAFEKNSQIYKILAAGAPKLYEYLCEKGYDTIVCAHVFSALMLTALLEEHPEATFRTCFIATDYTCSPSVRECSMDVYIIPDDSLTEEFVQNGIPREKIYGVGIPVREAFMSRTETAAAKTALGLDPSGRHVLMMCGSMGCGPMERMTALLAKALPEDVFVSVVCGTNKPLYQKLSRKYAKDSRMQILGYVKDIPLRMDSADLYLTKPGGISVTEAAAKQLPMVLIDAVAGCEEYNLRYFVDRGMACTATKPKELAELCISVLEDSSRHAAMVQAMQTYAHADAADRIFDLLTGTFPASDATERT